MDEVSSDEDNGITQESKDIRNISFEFLNAFEDVFSEITNIRDLFQQIVNIYDKYQTVPIDNRQAGEE